MSVITQESVNLINKKIDQILNELNKEDFENWEDILQVTKKQSLNTIIDTFDPSLVSDIISNCLKSKLFALAKISHTEEKSFFYKLYKLLDVSLWCVINYENVDQTLTFSLIADSIDILTIKGGEKIFDYIDFRLEKLTDKMEANKGKGLNLLRLCNEMVKRLSKAGEALFCGVNHLGDFNLDNVTFFEREKVEDNMETGETIKKDKPLEDKKFFNIFWDLQQYYSNPMKLLTESNDIFKSFQSNLEIVLSRFEKLNPKKDEKTRNYDDYRRRKDEQMVLENNSSLNKQHFFPKYLTGANLLFNHELEDPFFRKQILVQILIILQFLLFSTENEKVKLQKFFEENSVIQNKKSKFYSSFTFSSDQASWLSKIRRDFMVTLENIPPFGKQFQRTLTTVISHEANWIRWKNLGAKPFEKESIKVEKGIKRFKKKTTKAIQREGEPAYMGTAELTTIWADVPDMNSALMDMADSIAESVKPLDKYLKILDLQLDSNLNPEEGQEEEYLCYNEDKTYDWCAYRIARSSDFKLFASVPNTPGPVKPVGSKTLLGKWREENRIREEKKNDVALIEKKIEEGEIENGELIEDDEGFSIEKKENFIEVIDLTDEPTTVMVL
ncbi:hypothetical protein HDU92_002866 [Lobulomyces angularis]|nr:hypothetical protein HDU92_002866 [Lobulomyces angularis]